MYTIIQISIIALNYGKEIMNYAVFLVEIYYRYYAFKINKLILKEPNYF